MKFNNEMMVDHVKIAQLDRGVTHKMKMTLANQFRLSPQYGEWRALAIKLNDHI